MPRSPQTDAEDGSEEHGLGLLAEEKLDLIDKRKLETDILHMQLELVFFDELITEQHISFNASVALTRDLRYRMGLMEWPSS